MGKTVILYLKYEVLRIHEANRILFFLCHFALFSVFVGPDFLIAAYLTMLTHNQENGMNITANALHPGSIATNLLRYHSIIDGNT